jgi:hypothetical protein
MLDPQRLLVAIALAAIIFALVRFVVPTLYSLVVRRRNLESKDMQVHALAERLGVQATTLSRWTHTSPFRPRAARDSARSLETYLQSLTDKDRVKLNEALQDLVRKRPLVQIRMKKAGLTGQQPEQQVGEHPLTQATFVKVLREQSEQDRTEARVAGRQQLVINSVFAIASLILGWLISAVVHLPGQH